MNKIQLLIMYGGSTQNQPENNETQSKPPI